METVKKKKAGFGRPEKPVKKDVRAAVRFSKTEYFVIRSKAAKAGVKVSAYLRQLAIHANIRPRLTDEERQVVRQLVGMSNNLNQLAKACHQEGSLKAVFYFEGYRQQIDDLLKRFRYD